MPTKLPRLLLSCFIWALSIVPSGRGDQDVDGTWTRWLDDVRPIMTRGERSVFESLKTEEDRLRFRKLFWEARDPTPGTAANEYMIEFRRRSRYAEDRLDGVDSDRGKIYILLGEPRERRNYSGYELIEDCELWTYHVEDKPGIPPDLNLIFHRPQGIGPYKLFYPGAQSALDILSAQYMSGMKSSTQAYGLLRSSFPELAGATVSVIPGEGTDALWVSMNSSNRVLGDIFSLPDREAKSGYLTAFGSPGGTVDVSVSDREIGGWGHVSLTGRHGLRFLSYSLMPHVLTAEKRENDTFRARILLNVRIEDAAARTIVQQDRMVNVSFDRPEMESMTGRDKKVVFSDFLPVIEGDFTVHLRYFNETANEFFTRTEKVSVDPGAVPVLLGHQVLRDDTAAFAPFRLESHKVLFDPRFIYQPDDSLEGVIITAAAAEVRLSSLDDPEKAVTIPGIRDHGDAFVFRQPLADIAAGNYALTVGVEGRIVFRQKVFVLPFRFEKPRVFERIEPDDAENGYVFMLGREHLSRNDAGRSLELFRLLPESFWDSTNVVFLAQAHYAGKNYAEAVALLDRDDVRKDYSILRLLANSYLGLRRYPDAAQTFERLRQYGETVEILNALGAVYLTLGEKDKARLIWARAKDLEEKKKS